MTHFNIGDDVIYSSDVIARIEELREIADTDGLNLFEADEYKQLMKIQTEFSGYGDWEYGEILILESHFVEYTEELIKDCYPDIPEQGSVWPYCHITIDYEAAATDLKMDYTSVDLGDGVEYLMRA